MKIQLSIIKKQKFIDIYSEYYLYLQKKDCTMAYTLNKQGVCVLNLHYL